jgi:transcriptional regulator NrdR family protein
MKCSICGKKMETTFLGKILGTYVKKKPVCPECQKKFTTKEELEKNLK